MAGNLNMAGRREKVIKIWNSNSIRITISHLTVRIYKFVRIYKIWDSLHLTFSV